jgi:alanyl-tRNA synthetase
VTSKDIRQSFLDYFARQGHAVVGSAPLVPGEDPTLLFTNAGMNQFKDLFLGRDTRAYQRATTVQKCMRVSGKHNDLENVGPSLRHHTFFEMLGNFSFGDYFKQDAIPFAWELLTKTWSLSPDRLFPTIFRGDANIPRDEEAFNIWKGLVPESRITELGLAENFWQMGETGPCGRCSEIHYFRGDQVPCPEPVCRGIDCSCDRYVEVWNNVFMEFDRSADGTLTPLPALCVDTGMGLERVTAVIQGKISNYDTDLFMPILEAIGLRAGRPYSGAPGPLDHPDVSMRVVADHLRAMTFLIADGVLPSNEWRGYVLRKIMRRAMRHGKRLGLTKPFLYELAEVVVSRMGLAYPELKTERDNVVRTIRAEEDRFDAVLVSGLPKLEDLIDRTIASGSKAVSGEDVFRLYDSLGVPFDFAEDLAGQRGLTVDREAYESAMEGQREKARAGSAFGKTAGTASAAGAGTPAWVWPATLQQRADVFTGYSAVVEPAAKVLGVQPADGRNEFHVYLDRTPFYVRSGGQVSDTGILTSATGLRAEVLGVEKPDVTRPRAHLVRVLAGAIAAGDVVTASVDADVRAATQRNHTATHLLHAALRQRLGSHVRQAGSLVAPDRLRFDYNHFQALTDDDRRHVERVVNEQVYRNTTVTTEERSTEDAIKAGAMALFGEKYGDRVRVVSVSGFSQELCGGTHVRATGDIGPFVIREESGVAAGVRRIEALTGRGAVEHIQSHEAALDRTLAALGVPADQAPEAIARLHADAKRLARENEQLKMKIALGGGSGPGEVDDTVSVGDTKFIARRVAGLEKGALRGLSDSLRDRLTRGVVVLAAESDGKVHLLVSVTKDLTDRVQAGQLVKALAPIVGGGGGGRPDFAEAGGKDPSKIDEMLARARELLTTALG